jgi:hypothetical protein
MAKRCSYITPKGPCGNSSDGEFCHIHRPKVAEANLNQYRINCAMLGESLNRHHQADQMKNVSAEVAILRSLLEARLNMVENDAELVAAMPVLKDLALTVDKLAQSCHNMDVKLGNLLDKQALMTLAQEIIQIIDSNLRPLVDTAPTTQSVDELIETIGHRLIEAVASMENKP